jgi:hypothetical protein
VLNRWEREAFWAKTGKAKPAKIAKTAKYFIKILLINLNSKIEPLNHPKLLMDKF